MPGQPQLQLRQGHVGDLGERCVDQVRMRFGAVREPISALRLGSSIAAGPAQRVPSDGAGGAEPEVLGCLTARQARVDGGQDARAEIKRIAARACGPASFASPPSESDATAQQKLCRVNPLECRTSAESALIESEQCPMSLLEHDPRQRFPLSRIML